MDCRSWRGILIGMSGGLIPDVVEYLLRVDPRVACRFIGFWVDFGIWDGFSGILAEATGCVSYSQ